MCSSESIWTIHRGIPPVLLLTLLYRGKIEVLLKTQIFHILLYRHLLLQRQFHEKDHHSISALNLDRTFMGLGDGFGNSKSQTVMIILCSPGLVSAIKPFKKMFSLFLRYFPAFVCDGQNCAVFYPFQFQADLFRKPPVQKAGSLQFPFPEVPD